MDAGVISIALPSLQRDFPVGATQVWWVLMAYFIAAASSAMVMGVVGDRLGRRRVYLWGQALFVAGCLLSAFAPSIDLVVVARGLQGVGAGTVTALSLAMLTQVVRAEVVPRLEGWWMAISAGAAALGPLAGGAVVAWLGWRWVFGLEAVLMILAVVLVLVLVGRDFGRSTSIGRVDAVGVSLLTVGIVCTVGGLGMTDDHTFLKPQVWLPVLLGMVFIAILVAQQRRTSRPLADWSMMGRAPIPAVISILAIKVLVMTGALLQEALLIQNALGFGAIVAGATAFAMSAMVTWTSPISPWLMSRAGTRLTIASGLLLIAGAFAGLSRIDLLTSPWQVASWMAVAGVGVGIADPALNATALRAVPKPSLGAFAGFLSLVLALAGALGIAVMGSFASVLVTADWLERAPGTIDPASLTDRVVAGELAVVGAGSDPATASLAATSFAYGATSALLVASIVLGACAIAAMVLLPRKHRTHDTVDEPGGEQGATIQARP